LLIKHFDQNDMANFLRTYITPLLIAVFILTGSTLGQTASAQTASMQKGATVFGKATDDFSSARFKQSVDDFVAIGGTDLALLYHIYQDNETSNSLNAGWNTPTDQALRDGINYAHGKGLRVMVVLKADTLNNTWHANIDPADRNAWFNNYKTWLLKIANIGKDTGLEQISIGTELYKVASEVYNPDNTTRWKNLISSVRAIYTGKLVYGVQHTGDRSELLELGFGSDLDFLGISAYFPLTAAGATIEQALRNSWIEQEVLVNQARTRYGKPVIFTEAGYRSIVDSHIDPYSFWRNAPVDLNEQVRNYEAMFSFWTTKTYFQGAYIWAWETDPNAGGPLDTTFTPQNKPAEQTLCKWFKHNGTQACTNTGTTTPPTGGTGTTTPPTTTASNTDFSVSGGMQPESAIGDPVNTLVGIKANQNTNGVIVQAEIFNEQWKQVARKTFDAQNLTAGQEKLLNFTWIPQAIGVYQLKVGLFAADWSRTLGYFSLDNAKTRTTERISGGTTPGTGPGNSAITVWWPTASAVKGIQPIRALIEGMPLDSYTMTWQIDGGTATNMIDGTSPSPHKVSSFEAWKLAAGAHTLTITAKNTSGTVIATKTVTITTAK
jgi:hypothetical protein